MSPITSKVNEKIKKYRDFQEEIKSALILYAAFKESNA